MSAEKQLDHIVAVVDRILAILEAQPQRSSGAPQQAAVADDADLDSQYGNPEVKRDPPAWAKKNLGRTVAPCLMSEGPADWLDALASLYDWQAGKDAEQGKTYTNKKGEEVETAPFKRRDAARARGWSARVRAGKVKRNEPDENLPF